MDAFFCSVCQGWLCKMGPFPPAWQPLSSPILCGFTRQPSWVGFSVLSPEPETGLYMFPWSPLYPNHGNLTFFHNWHRLCWGQEPNINYKDWPQPRELEKKLDNTVGKLFPHINWYLKYVRVLCAFFYATEPDVVENTILALVSILGLTWAYQQGNPISTNLFTHHTLSTIFYLGSQQKTTWESSQLM